MFIQNKYKIWYDAIVARAKTRNPAVLDYVEVHHIIPNQWVDPTTPITLLH